MSVSVGKGYVPLNMEISRVAMCPPSVVSIGRVGHSVRGHVALLLSCKFITNKASSLEDFGVRSWERGSSYSWHFVCQIAIVLIYRVCRTTTCRKTNPKIHYRDLNVPAHFKLVTICRDRVCQRKNVVCSLPPPAAWNLRQIFSYNSRTDAAAPSDCLEKYASSSFFLFLC